MYRFAMYDACAEEWEDAFLDWVGEPFNDPQAEIVRNTLEVMNNLGARNPNNLYNVAVMVFDAVEQD